MLFKITNRFLSEMWAILVLLVFVCSCTAEKTSKKEPSSTITSTEKKSEEVNQMKNDSTALLVVKDSIIKQAVEKVEDKQEEKTPVAEKKKEEVKKKPKKRAKAKFENKTHEYGLIMQGDKVEHQFKFKNVGNANLLIKDVRASCGCTQPSYPFVPIKPGEEGLIGVVFDSKGKLGQQKPTITVVTNARPHTYKLYLDGIVDAPRADEKTN